MNNTNNTAMRVITRVADFVSESMFALAKKKIMRSNSATAKQNAELVAAGAKALEGLATVHTNVLINTSALEDTITTIKGNPDVKVVLVKGDALYVQNNNGTVFVATIVD